MKPFTMNDLHSHLPQLQPGELILDVRSREEFQDGRVSGSQNIPYDEVILHVEELKKHQKIYIYCHAGVRAGIAADILTKAGLQNLVSISTTGMKDWFSAGYPLEK